MPDWQQFVRERLGRVGISPQRDDEITEELAGYLDDRAAETSCADLSHEVGDWQGLARNLRAANLEGVMNRTSSLWLVIVLLLPTTILSLALLKLEPDTGRAFLPLADRSSKRGVIFHVYAASEARFQAMYIFIPWLAALPLIGAGAARYARRAGAPARQQFVISMFPAVVMFGVLCIGMPRQVLLNPASLAVFFGGVLAACLLLGALPFLRNSAPDARKAA